MLYKYSFSFTLHYKVMQSCTPTPKDHPPEAAFKQEWSSEDVRPLGTVAWKLDQNS